MSSSASSTESDAASQQPEVLGRSREGMIAESMKNGEDIQKQFPSVDFKGAVIEPTVNLTFDIQQHVDDANQRRYNTLMAEMLKNTADPAFAERLLWEARSCLRNYPEVLGQFDSIFISKRPVPDMIRELHEVLTTKKETVRRMSLQNPEQGVATGTA
ncbi:hypothetical protein CGCF415_v002366 [Colletotrichum fructicola]|nr:uncharacterized protein CGMCC3_g4709 [Colletotrichum fructicola]KAH9240822.1 hypothetical protein K456DRAFT_29337 [Colletotrichum gloeosporioides 23]CAI0643390.1 unnamed protein product [Colletotrichum noveboracense]KAE9579482.1 hypothetical protein CGMCC3_g4709 [Colletotrichum fructicola]KAF4429697.1 hypothetical protein CFRS1_v011839 [Colletotrichum fructicola]KAF4902488.1 hypothetical protein CGCFRS4_v002160 [Colletotrichum fructicola]